MWRNDDMAIYHIRTSETFEPAKVSKYSEYTIWITDNDEGIFHSLLEYMNINVDVLINWV